MPPEKILLIRHGETDWNAQKRWQGFAQTSLNTRGLQQAGALAGYLGTWPISAIYSSDLIRTVETATPLSQALDVPVQLDERWREIHVGKYQGLSFAEVEERFPDEVVARRADIWHFVNPGGESRRDLQKRVLDAWGAIADSHPGAQVAVFSHAGPIKVMLWSLFGEDDERFNAYIPNTSVTTLEYKQGGWRLAGLAETPHL